MPMRPRVGGEVMPGGREGDGGGVGEMAARVSGIGTDADADAKAEAHHQEQEERSGRCQTWWWWVPYAEKVETQQAWAGDGRTSGPAHSPATLNFDGLL
jgi:hypothetical protein